MTKDEILEGNKLIANFIGISFNFHLCNHPLDPEEWEQDYKFPEWLTEEMTEYLYFFEGPIDHIYDELKFYSSWDWLMPVIDKIESLGYKWEIGMSAASPYHYCKIWNIGTIEGISMLDAIYGACIEFIKWYNEVKNIINNK